MGAHHYEITVDAPAERLWQAIADFGGIWRMNAAVPSSHLTSERQAGVGMTRHCELTVPGASIEERVTGWHEGESYTIEIYDGVKAPPFRTNEATLRVRPDGADRAVLTFAFVYELRYGTAGRLMERTLVEPRFGPAIRRLPASIARHVETGEVVTDQTDLSSELARVRSVVTDVAA